MAFDPSWTAAPSAAAATAPHLEFSCATVEPDAAPPDAAPTDATPAATVTDAPTPNLADYDLIVVNSSAGKDSQAALDVVAEYARAAGVLERVVVVHADLGDAEWDGVPELAAEHAAHYGVRFELTGRTAADGHTETILV